MGSYHQRSDRFLTRNNAESKISIIGRPSATPLYDIGVEIRPKPKKKYLHQKSTLVYSNSYFLSIIWVDVLLVLILLF